MYKIMAGILHLERKLNDSVNLSRGYTLLYYFSKCFCLVTCSESVLVHDHQCQMTPGRTWKLLCTDFLTFCKTLYSQNRTVRIRQQLRQMKGGSVLLTKDVRTGIATIIIKNPGRMNSFTGNMMVDFDNCVRKLESWQHGRGVVLTGANGTFCTGGDFNTVRKILFDGGAMQMSAYVQDTTSRLFNLPMISVAVIDGYALGGGAELSTACDFRIMTPTAKIGFLHAKLNIATAFGGCTRLVRLLGRTKTLLVLSSGKVMNAKEAYTLGLVDDIVKGNADAEEIGKQWLFQYLYSEALVKEVTEIK